MGWCGKVIVYAQEIRERDGWRRSSWASTGRSATRLSRDVWEVLTEGRPVPGMIDEDGDEFMLE